MTETLQQKITDNYNGLLETINDNRLIPTIKRFLAKVNTIFVSLPRVNGYISEFNDANNKAIQELREEIENLRIKKVQRQSYFAGYVKACKDILDLIGKVKK